MKKLYLAAAALGCLLVTGSAFAQEPAQESNSPVGCWMLSAPNSKIALIPPMTKIRLDSVPSPIMKTHFVVERISHTPPEITTEEQADWFINPGDGHVIIKLGDAATTFTFDAIVNGKRMDGRLASGPIRGDRIKCPKPKN